MRDLILDNTRKNDNALFRSGSVEQRVSTRE
jgi:hypothetical protein